jgi:integrase/recombinase XerD
MGSKNHKKYRGESRIEVHFEKDANMIAHIKQFEDSKWSQQLKVWHLPANEENRIRFKLATEISLLPSEERIIQIEKFQQWLS